MVEKLLDVHDPSDMFLATLYTIGSVFSLAMASRPKALVYRSEGTICDGCAEAVAQLLETSPSNFSTAYCGPDEDIKLSKDALSKVDVFAVGGGPGEDLQWTAIRAVC